MRQNQGLAEAASLRSQISNFLCRNSQRNQSASGRVTKGQLKDDMMLLSYSTVWLILNFYIMQSRFIKPLLPDEELHSSPLLSASMWSLHVKMFKLVSVFLFFNLGEVHTESTTSITTCARSMQFPGPAPCGWVELRWHKMLWTLTNS